jgi:hypothetical protein
MIMKHGSGNKEVHIMYAVCVDYLISSFRCAATQIVLPILSRCP